MLNQSIHKVYKIRDKTTGLFSRGGSRSYNLWTKEGKSWTNIGHVKNHMSQFIRSQSEKVKDYPYENAEILEVVINYEMCFKSDANDLFTEIIEKRAKTEKEWQDKHRKWEEEQERKQLQQLKAKYG